MPRNERQQILDKYKRKIEKEYIEGTIENKSSTLSHIMPRAEEARIILHKEILLCGELDKRKFRAIIVEDLNDFKVVIQIPDKKKALKIRREELRELKIEVKQEITCDYNVWIIQIEENSLRVFLPTHDFMFNWYNELRRKLPQGLMFNLIEELIRRRKNYKEIINSYSKEGNFRNMQMEIERFLATLKWIILEEDVNYPPPRYLGSKYTLAAYALLEMGFSTQEIRRLIRF